MHRREHETVPRAAKIHGPRPATIDDQTPVIAVQQKNNPNARVDIVQPAQRCKQLLVVCGAVAQKQHIDGCCRNGLQALR
jgi:hypothetical protein